MKCFETKNFTPAQTLDFLTAAISPRPIAWVSTLSKSGVPNLAPFSFFNAFGSNPPVVVFSPSRRVRDGTNKDTLLNLLETKACVIHVVPFSQVHKMNETSKEFDQNEDEFEKAGLTKIASTLVKPFRLKESPIAMECILTKHIELGQGPGSGNLCICEVLCFHIDESLLTEKNTLDPTKLDLVSRGGGAWYTRSHPNSMFELKKPS